MPLQRPRHRGHSRLSGALSPHPDTRRSRIRGIVGEPRSCRLADKMMDGQRPERQNEEDRDTEKGRVRERQKKRTKRERDRKMEAGTDKKGLGQARRKRQTQKKLRIVKTWRETEVGNEV